MSFYFYSRRGRGPVFSTERLSDLPSVSFNILHIYPVLTRRFVASGAKGNGGGSGKHSSAAPALTSAAAAASSAATPSFNLPPALKIMAASAGGAAPAGGGTPGKGRVHNPIEDAYDTKAPWSPGSKPVEPGSPVSPTVGGKAGWVSGQAGPGAGAGPNGRRGLW